MEDQIVKNIYGGLFKGLSRFGVYLFVKTNLLFRHHSTIQNPGLQQLAHFPPKAVRDFVLKNPERINEVSPNKLSYKTLCASIEKNGPQVLRHMNGNDQLIEQLLSENGSYLKYVPDQTERMCQAAVVNDLTAFQFVQDQTENLCKMVVRQDGKLLKWVHNQTEDINRAAVINDPNALQYVQNQTKDLCLLAVQRDGEQLRWVHSPTEEINRAAIINNPNALQYVQNQTKDLCLLAVQRDGEQLKWVRQQTEEICRVAVAHSPATLRHIYTQTPEICKLAIDASPDCFEYVNIKTPEICKYTMERIKSESPQFYRLLLEKSPSLKRYPGKLAEMYTAVKCEYIHLQGAQGSHQYKRSDTLQSLINDTRLLHAPVQEQSQVARIKLQ